MRKRFINVFCVLKVNKGSDFVEDFTNIGELQNGDNNTFFCIGVIYIGFLEGREKSLMVKFWTLWLTADWLFVP